MIARFTELMNYLTLVDSMGGVPPPQIPWTEEKMQEGVPGFQITRDDIEIVARDWFRVAQLGFWDEFTGNDHDPSYRVWYCVLGLNRLAFIAKYIGDQSVQEIMDYTNRSLANEHGVETWRVFTTGTQQERDALRRSFAEDRDRCDKKAHDPIVPVAAAEHLRKNPSGVFADADGDLWYLSETHNGLVLKIRGPTGQSVCADEFVVDRPPGWHRPFGLK